MIPVTNGISAARPRKNSIESPISSSGNASSSANPRSLVTVELICSLATAEPPTVTSRLGVNAATRGLRDRLVVGAGAQRPGDEHLAAVAETAAGPAACGTPGNVVQARATIAAIRGAGAACASAES